MATKHASGTSEAIINLAELSNCRWRSEETLDCVHHNSYIEQVHARCARPDATFLSAGATGKRLGNDVRRTRPPGCPQLRQLRSEDRECRGAAARREVADKRIDRDEEVARC